MANSGDIVDSSNRYSVGAGANVSFAFRQAEYISFLKNEFGATYFDNKSLQKTVYSAIAQTITATNPTISQQITFNPNIIPNMTMNFHEIIRPGQVRWDNNGNLDVATWRDIAVDPNWVLEESIVLDNIYPNTGGDFTNYRNFANSFIDVTTPYPIIAQVSSTPIKEGKHYFEIEIIEDSSYIFYLTPVGWTSENIAETGAYQTLAMGTFYWQGINPGSGKLVGSWSGGSGLGDNLENFNYPVSNTAWQSGDILQIALNTEDGVAYVGINGIYCRWNASGTYTTMDPTNISTGAIINGNGDTLFQLVAAPMINWYDPGYDRISRIANCNVRILTGNACNYSPPVGYTDH